MMLGKGPARKNPKGLKLKTYLPRLPVIPERVRWDTMMYQAYERSALGNFYHGVCVTASCAKYVMSCRANESMLLQPITTDQVIETAKKHDALEGWFLLDCMKVWKRDGLFGTKVDAFVSVEKSIELIKAAIWIFGGIKIGLSMPRAWEYRDVWDTSSKFFDSQYRKGSWGGHDLLLCGFEKDGLIGDTWDKTVLITPPAVLKYMDEGFAFILPEWSDADHVTPSGFDSDLLYAHLAEVD